MSQASHYSRSIAFTSEPKRAAHHNLAIWKMRESRDAAIKLVPDWEMLRSRAAQIKQHTLTHLSKYLEEFEKNALASGAKVHWAKNAEEHNRIVIQILNERAITRITKSKSMLTEECNLNHALEQSGIEVVDSDLGEFIIQSSGDRPSHIVAPAVHREMEEIPGLLPRSIKIENDGSETLETKIVAGVRSHLRNQFYSSQAGITGVNFAVAETGTLVVCTNEGNADLGTAIPKLHIASMGIEKVIPKSRDLAVFLRLLARSASGQPITAYSSHFRSPRPGSELHIVIVDNGRTEHLANPDYFRSLSCIRCGACLNTCPIFRQGGGHSYGYVVPGPIGIILATLRDPATYADLPKASTLCGSCTDVCPVKIDLHKQILKLRSKRPKSWLEMLGVAAMAALFQGPIFFRTLAHQALRIGQALPGPIKIFLTSAWSEKRSLPRVPRRRFHDLYREKYGN